MPLYAPRAHVRTRARPTFHYQTAIYHQCGSVSRSCKRLPRPKTTYIHARHCVYGRRDPFVGIFQSHSCYIHAFSTPEISESHFVGIFQYDVATSRYVRVVY